MPGVLEGKISRRMYLRVLLPVSLFFTMGVVLGNKAYAHISIGYIQMVKAITPVPLLLLYFLLGREKPSVLQLMIVMVISVGVMISSIGELRFSWVGFFLQVIAVEYAVATFPQRLSVCVFN